MAIVVESVQQASANATSVTCTKPSGTASGDLLVAHWAVRASRPDGTMVLPTDWVLVKYQQGSGASPSCKMAYKVAGGSEPADYTFSVSPNTDNHSVGMMRLSGVDTTTPSDVAASGNGAATGTTLTATAITTATAAFLIAAFASSQAASVITDPAGMDEKIAVTTNCRNTISTSQQVSAGNTGNKTATQSSDTRWTAILWAVRAAGGGGTNTPQSVAGTLTSAGTLSRATSKPIVGTLTSAGALIKAITKTFAGTLASAGDLLRTTGKVVAGALVPSGALLRTTGKALAGALTSAGDLVTSLTFLVSIGGALTSAGTLTRNVGKSLVGALTTSGAINRAITKAFAGILSFVGALIVAIVGGETELLDVEISDSAVYAVTLSDSAVYTALITDSAVYTVTLSDRTRS